MTPERFEGSAGSELGRLVAQSADAAELHAPVPTLLLELQTLLGNLGATVAAGTNRGRRPFRPGDDWARRLGELGYGVYLLADQTGVDLAASVASTAHAVGSQAPQQPPADPHDWPFEAH